MAGPSKIEWCTDTWNPIVGCSIVSPGCANCYAMRMADRLEAMTPRADGKGNPHLLHYVGTTTRDPTRRGYGWSKPVWTGKVALAPENILLQPLRWSKPRRIFVNSMGDLFHDSVPDEWIDQVFAVMALAPQHTFQVLTKRSARMQNYVSAPETVERVMSLVCDLAIERSLNVTLVAVPEHERHAPPGTRIRLWIWPLPNVWLGVSTERQQEWDERIADLKATPAAIRFVSAEPLLGPILGDMAGVDWVIVGGESGPGARPMHPDWARSIRDQCAAAGTAFHFKQIGEWGWPSDEAHHRDYAAACNGDGPWPHDQLLDLDGKLLPGDALAISSRAYVRRVGKRAAGRLLDGREHNDFPLVLA